MIAYNYKLYKNKRTKHLDNMLREACFVWNHALALQKRYHALYKAYIPCTRMQKHYTKRIKRTYMHSQSVQEVLQRLDTAYKRFFQHKAKRPPKFKKHADFKSFVFKQGGFSLCGNTFHLNSVKTDYRFSLSREYNGNVRQVRLKRSPKGEWYIYIVTDATSQPIAKSHNGASTGIDFGLKTYLTFSNGECIQHPQHLKRNLKKLRKLSKSLSKKQKDSNNRKKARVSVASFHEDVANKRKDYQWKLAHELCRKYDYIFIEDLNLKGMTRLWGRKVNDLAHGQFIEILTYVGAKCGCIVHKINKWYPSSRLCDCGYKNNDLKLSDREWVCPVCGQKHNRDIHAAEMILRRGIYELESGSKTNEAMAEGYSTLTLSA